MNESFEAVVYKRVIRQETMSQEVNRTDKIATTRPVVDHANFHVSYIAPIWKYFASNIQ